MKLIIGLTGMTLLLLGSVACSGGDQGAAPAGSARATAPPTPVATEQNTDPYAGFPTFPPGSADPTPLGGSTPPVEEPPPQAPVTEATSWRVLSARIFYDEGGGGDISDTITTHLELSQSGAWTFGSSSGGWTVSDITPDDWSRWEIDPYGPTRKIVLNGWNGAVADGPIEESGSVIDYIWVIYPEGPPTIQAAGTIWMKFGAA